MGTEAVKEVQSGLTGQPGDHYKGLPRRIHIGSRTWRIVVAKAEGHPVMEGNLGLTAFTEGRIYLDAGMDLHDSVNTVEHEVSHAINYMAGVEDGATEENFVTSNTNGLLELQLRNPRYMNWLMKQLRALRKEATRD